MKAYRIRKDDKVMVITGKDKGKVGKVLKILRKKDRVLVEKEMPIHVSNVMVVCSACAKPTRVGYKYIESEGKTKKVRFCKECNEVME